MFTKSFFKFLIWFAVLVVISVTSMIVVTLLKGKDQGQDENCEEEIEIEEGVVGCAF